MNGSKFKEIGTVSDLITVFNAKECCRDSRTVGITLSSKFDHFSLVCGLVGNSLFVYAMIFKATKNCIQHIYFQPDCGRYDLLVLHFSSQQLLQQIFRT